MELFDLKNQHNLRYKSFTILNSDVEEANPLVLPKGKVEELRPPSKYEVLLLNDDFTPMDFVVEILQKFFGFNEERATHIMMQVHKQGQASCGVFTRDIAETKSEMVNGYARQHHHPLLSQVRRFDDS